MFGHSRLKWPDVPQWKHCMLPGCGGPPCEPTGVCIRNSDGICFWALLGARGAVCCRTCIRANSDASLSNFEVRSDTAEVGSGCRVVCNTSIVCVACARSFLMGLLSRIMSCTFWYSLTWSTASSKDRGDGYTPRVRPPDQQGPGKNVVTAGRPTCRSGRSHKAHSRGLECGLPSHPRARFVAAWPGGI